MYRIVKLLNNNVAIVRTEKNEQAVVMGTGIIYQKKKGDLIPQDKIEKIFLLKNEESERNFSTLLKDIPLDFITMSYEIIDNAVNNHHYFVQEYIYVTLTDHIYWSYQYLNKGKYEVSKLPDISQQYPIEYQIGKETLAIIEKRLGTEFPKDEIGRIALHFINAKKTDSIAQEETKDVGQEIINLVKEELAKYDIYRTKENKNFYDRLMIHLTYFVDRLIESGPEKDTFIMSFEENIRYEYPKAYEIGNNIYKAISKHIGKTLSGSERVYFTIHIQRLL